LRRGVAAWLAAIVAAASVATLLAAPWLAQELMPCAWLGVAAGLFLATGRRGWRGELTVFAAALVVIACASQWTPEALASCMRSEIRVGLAFAAPIVLWDACRMALPFWWVGRAGGDPRASWLPAALVAVVAEAVVPAVFPWRLGYVHLAWPLLVQSADLLGAEGSTFMFFAHGGALVTLATPLLGMSGRRMPVAGYAALVVCAANAAYGGVAIWRHAALAAAAPTLRVALVQVNPERHDAIDDLRRLTRDACADPRPPALVCWPECSGGSYEDGLESFADPEPVWRRSRPPQRGLRPLPDPACHLLLGGKIYRGYPERPRQIFQSAILVDEAERLVGTYHKRHLMPFGEYVPGGDLITDLRLHFPMENEFSVGGAATVLECRAARLGVMLCYEDMVPAAAASLAARGANLLVSLINGSAFTNPLTLEQHRMLAQLRAVENRRCLVRCAATGETCVIAPTGAVTDRLPLSVEDVLLADVPLVEGRTLANVAAGWFPVACGLGLVAWLGWSRAGRLAAG
jgi:apolipoprotein N-acyltransferase